MVTLTEKAIEKVVEKLKERGTGLGIRLGIKTTGCNGFAYVLEFVDDTTDFDKIFEQEDFLVVINEKDLIHLEGVVVDYVKEGLNEGFEYQNPHEKSRCGCGESFQL